MQSSILKYMTWSLALHLCILLYGMRFLYSDNVALQLRPSHALSFMPASLFKQDNPQTKSLLTRDHSIKKGVNVTKSFTHQALKPRQMLNPLSEGTNKLLQLLHQAIASNQTYPEQAANLDQSGTVTVSFDLFPTGSIRNLHIVHHSGSAILDEAAMVAVVKSAPFTDAKKYLHSVNTFSLDIIYA